MAAPSALFEVVSGKAVGMSILVEDELVLGRNADGAGKLAEDGELSRSHARIALDGNGFCAIEDLGSTNGTFVNGLRLSAPQTLSEGDTIELGATTLVARAVPDLKSHPTAERDTPQVPAAPGAPQAPGDPQAPGAPQAPGDSPAPEAAPAPGAPPAPAAPPAPEAATAPPAAPAAADVQPPAEQAVAAAMSALSLQLEVDFATNEARLMLGGVDEPVRLIYDDGVWRFAPPASTEERDSV